MRIEGHHHDRQAKLGCRGPGAGDDPLVAAVYTVELADSNDAPAPLGWYVVQAMPPLHLLVS
jgi:hypothetical protein